MAASLRAAGVLPGLALDGALGRIDPVDLWKWAAEYRAAIEADRCRGGWVTPTPGGPVLGVKAPPKGEVIWLGSVGKKGRRVQRVGVVTATVPAELWTLPGERGWWRVPDNQRAKETSRARDEADD